jgi:hypothetical protein
LYAEVDLLLTPEQYQLAVPDTLARYFASGSFIVYERSVIPVSHVLGLTRSSEKPQSLLNYDSTSRSLSQISKEVCMHIGLDMFFFDCMLLQYQLEYLSPHPMKEKSAGRPVVMLPLVMFTDDTSGNKSKKWHKFDSFSIMIAGLPRHERSKIQNIHFCCCSDAISAVEMTEAIVPELISLSEGVEVYDALLEREVLVLAPLMCILADNPRASELLNHLGGAARRYCRMCMVCTDFCLFVCLFICFGGDGLYNMQ